MARASTAPSTTRQAILDATLDLLAEEGYAGASLRKVAARVGIAQPSLYHHFKTKEDLVEQVIGAGAGRMFGALDPDAFPKTLEEVPRAILQTVRALYSTSQHPKFVRVAFAVARLNSRYEQLMKTIFIDQATVGMQMFVQPFVQAGEIEASAGVHLVRMLVNAAGLRMIEYRVLFGQPADEAELEQYLLFVEDAGEKLVAAYRAK
ncbi:MAG: TetR/AcrR family transcriptional regulator [Myxococcota bacterium]